MTKSDDDAPPDRDEKDAAIQDVDAKESDIAVLPDTYPAYPREDASSHRQPDAEILTAKIAYTPADRWTQDEVSQFYALPERFGVEPICRYVCHQKRVGKKANFAFLCHLVCPSLPTSKPNPFWLRYVHVLESPSCRAALEDRQFAMRDHIDIYSDGAEAWTSASEEDGSHRHRRTSGRAKQLKKKRAVPLRGGGDSSSSSFS